MGCCSRGTQRWCWPCACCWSCGNVSEPSQMAPFLSFGFPPSSTPLLPACCPGPTNSSALFNCKAAIGPLLMGADHELSSDVLQWWLVSDAMSRSLWVFPGSLNLTLACLWLKSVNSNPVMADPCVTHVQSLLLARVTCCPCLVGPRAWDQWTSRLCTFVLGHTILLSFRVNRANVTGFELDVGMRTTHHSMYPESAVNLRPNTHLCLLHRRTHMVCQLWVIASLVLEVFILSPAFLKYIHDTRTQHHGWYPSTGCPSPSMFGFRADSEGNWHHYWEKNWSRAFHRTRVPDPDVEFSLIKRRAHESRIVFYK
uniref:Uncharacterized protein n=1 Tax=Catharus ustulatus TaxID=91951 RepID=A0A8C3Y439_CATUS